MKMYEVTVVKQLCETRLVYAPDATSARRDALGGKGELLDREWVGEDMASAVELEVEDADE